MEEQNSKRAKVAIPTLGIGKLASASQQESTPMTTREEQAQYKLRGIQDGKVEELINHEKRAEEN